MNSLLWFIPLAVCLLIAMGGAICAGVALIGLSRIRAARPQVRDRDALPPAAPGSTQHATAPSGCWRIGLKLLLAVALAVLALGMLGAWSTRFSVWYVPKAPTEWSDGRAPGLEALIRKHCAPFVQQGKSIGMAVAVVTPTNTTVMTFGRPALTRAAQTRPDTLFELGSITKTFTGLALARAIERGSVQLEQPIQELLPEEVKLPNDARSITLRHLTTHSSGFPRMPADRSPLPAIGMMLFGTDPYRGYDEAQLLADVRNVKLEFQPGTKASYSNFGMMLLGYLLARNAGGPYEALIRRDVCLPLEMNDTTMTLSKAQADRMAQGYRAVWRCGRLIVALRSAPWFVGNDLGGAGALRSTATDMLKYLEANMHPDGQPIADALRESHEVLMKEDERFSYGMNWVHLRSPKLKQPVIWHNGGTGGFRSFIGFTEDSRFGVVILSNSSDDVDSLALALLAELEAHF